MGSYHAPNQALTDPMPRSSSSEAAAIGARGRLPPPPPVAFGYSPKLEFDENDDALGEAEPISLNGHVDATSQDPQKPGSESGPSSGSGTKRKRPLKLTPSQRERKRAIDREAQRSIRIKTKNYIAHLENLVKVMEQSDTTGPDGDNNRTRELMNQLRQSQDEVRRLRDAMLGVQRSLSTVLDDSNALNLDSTLQRQSSHSSSPPENAEPQSSTSFTAATQFPSPSQTTHILQPPQLQSNPSTRSIPTIPSQSEYQSPPPQDLLECPKPNPGRRRIEGELFFYAEYHLNRVYAAGTRAFGDQAFDEDIAVRAVIEGWAAVEDQYTLDLAWQVIREIDQVVWANSGIVERMAIIRFMRTKLLYQVNSRAQGPLPPIPDFMTLEVVKHARHADIINHFIWPGFRNCLVEQPQKYITNYFSDKFRYNLKFLWPYDVSDTYIKDPLTQLYSSTPDFLGRQWNIRCWTMKTRFFDGCEDLMSSIPTFEVPLNKSLSIAAPPQINMKTGSFDMGNHAATGMVEEQEVDDTEGLDQSAGMVNDPVNMNGNIGVSHPAAGDIGIGAGWHSISPSQGIQQYWSMDPVNANGIDQEYNGLVIHAVSGYPM